MVRRFLSLIILLASVAFANNYYGYVLDGDGAGIQGVALKGIYGSTVDALTEAGGYYHFNVTGASAQSVNLSKNGYISDTVSIYYYSNPSHYNYDTLKRIQTISFSLPTPTYGDASFTLPCSTSSPLDGLSALPITYSSLNTSVATVVGNTVTIVGGGTATIRATQGGNSVYAPADTVKHILTVNTSS